MSARGLMFTVYGLAMCALVFFGASWVVHATADMCGPENQMCAAPGNTPGR